MENSLTIKVKQRPNLINEILNTLKRYDANVIRDLEEYLKQQCVESFNDVQANLCLLKLYELSSEDITEERENSTINILLLGLLEFYNVDFELYLHLLPSYSLSKNKKSSNEESNKDNKDNSDDDRASGSEHKNKSEEELSDDEEYMNVESFQDSVNKIFKLYEYLNSCNFTKFWSVIKNSKEADSYQDLILNSLIGENFEKKIKYSILKLIYLAFTNNNEKISSRISKNLLKNYLNLYDDVFFQKFISENEPYWKIDKKDPEVVLINNLNNLINDKDNKESNNEEKKENSENVSITITNENIKIEQLSRIIRNSFVV
ncbi:ARM repeat-containing protein [Ascoidea rubescens DSM 1968]|uniref:Eukaryotic translation initiation factor 3 subunit K n=1 Tax=Ascoidea rubescens DSM 1968 TaxID=1344418 RepID=A0A1D2VKM7_9ASCO|nr:ARM repeat-containing protein [Ascoidea rubescens DSM 1968]ODV62156.1 ARM repeat-containing protein [Ascoidea rubescens DSM 1968]